MKIHNQRGRSPCLVMRVATAALLTLGVGCSRGPIPEFDDEPSTPDLGDDGEAEGDGDGDGVGDGDGDGDGCEANELACDGTCVDPGTDPNNCGACGRTCLAHENPFVGGCWDGECLPVYSPCIASDAGWATCDEICAASGQSCRDKDDEHHCAPAAWAFVEGQEQACADREFSEAVGLSTFACGDTLPFDTQLISGICRQITCCCTQTAQELSP
jgi:hypothetical protein